MAVVYRAVTLDGRTVVIKRVLPALSRDPSFTKMLVAEARLSARLRHPGIVEVYEMGRVGDEYYLAMEYVDGVDLVRVLNRCLRVASPLPIGLACSLIVQVAGALTYAHDLTDDLGRSLGIVHRDVTPSNIMVTADGCVKLLDFGVAKAAEHVVDDRTRTGTLKGKVHYLSPEQADGMPVDRRADVFALGIVLHECLAMRRLFVGDGDLATLRLIRQADVKPPSAWRSEVEPELDALVLKMLSRDAADRFQTTAELAQALTPIAQRLGGGQEEMKAFIATLGPIERTVRAVDPTGMDAGPTPHASDEELDLIIEATPVARSPWLWRPSWWQRLPAAWQAPRVFWGAVGGSIAVVALVATLVSWAALRSHGRTLPTLPQQPVAVAAPPALVKEGTLMVSADVPAARFELDGALVADAARSARLSVPSGTHTLVVTAPRRKPFRRTFLVTTGATVELALHLEHLRPGTKRSENYLVNPFHK